MVRSEGGAVRNGISVGLVLLWKGPQRVLSPLLPCEERQRQPAMKQESGLCEVTKAYQTTHLLALCSWTFQCPGCGTNTSAVYKPPSPSNCVKATQTDSGTLYTLLVCLNSDGCLTSEFLHIQKSLYFDCQFDSYLSAHTILNAKLQNWQPIVHCCIRNIWC